MAWHSFNTIFTELNCSAIISSSLRDLKLKPDLVTLQQLSARHASNGYRN